MEQTVLTIVKEILDALGFPYESVAHVEIAGQSVFSIQSTSAPMLIGARGETIQALDFLIKKIYEKRLEDNRRAATSESSDTSTMNGVEERFLIDVNDFQVKRIKDLQTKAIMMADRARSLQYDVELTPMSAYERLIVHTTLQDQPQVKTESLGEGRNRRVVIKYTA